MHVLHFQNCAFSARPKISQISEFLGYLIDRIFIIILCFVLFLLMIAQQLAFHYFVNYNQRKLRLLSQRYSWNIYTLSSKFQLVANLAVLKVINFDIQKEIKATRSCFQILRIMIILTVYCIIINCCIVSIAFYMLCKGKNYESQLCTCILELTFPM